MSHKMDVGTAALAIAATMTERSAELINDGWVQGTWHKKESGAPTKFCVLGALDLAFEEIFGSMQGAHKNAAMELAKSMIIDEMFETQGRRLQQHGSIPGWNDSAGRTQEEVVGVLERAAKRLWDLSVVNEDIGAAWAPSAWAMTEEGEQAAKQYLTRALA